MPPADNQALVQRLAAQYGRQLRQFLIARVRNPADVPDLAQEVYLRLLRVSRAEAIQHPEAYLFTVARHVAQQHGLRQVGAPSRETLSQMLDPVEPPMDPVMDTAAQQLADHFQHTLDKLNPKARAAFILHRRDGLSPDEISVRMGISRPMVKKYLLKALIQLRVQLDATEKER